LVNLDGLRLNHKKRYYHHSGLRKKQQFHVLSSKVRIQTPQTDISLVSLKKLEFDDGKICFSKEK